MATQGAFNGTDVFIRVLDDSDQWLSVGGQVSHTETLNNALIDVTNKIGTPKYRELLPDEGLQSIDYSVDVIFTSQAGYDYVRELAGSKGQALFQVVKGDLQNGGFADTVVTLQVQNFVDTSADNDALRGTISLLSSDTFEWDAAITYDVFLTSVEDNFLTSTGDQFLVRSP